MRTLCPLLIQSLSAFAFCSLYLAGASAEDAAPASTEHATAEVHPTGMAPEVALTELKAGNSRFAQGAAKHPHQGGERRTELAKGQQPFAVVLGCADSRVAPEVLFDQGLGDLFVIRVAGNIVDDANLASIEYAVEHLGSRLIVVLGHENCGAVKAARETIASNGKAPGHLGALVDAIAPAVKSTSDKTVDDTVKAHISNVVTLLSGSKPVLAEKIASGAVKVVGARYDLDTSEVEFLRP